MDKLICDRYWFDWQLGLFRGTRASQNAHIHKRFLGQFVCKWLHRLARTPHQLDCLRIVPILRVPTRLVDHSLHLSLCVSDYHHVSNGIHLAYCLRVRKSVYLHLLWPHAKSIIQQEDKRVRMSKRFVHCSLDVLHQHYLLRALLAQVQVHAK